MLSLLASFTCVVAVCGSSYWLLSSSATFALTTASSSTMVCGSM